jgi:hypothetical protein
MRLEARNDLFAKRKFPRLFLAHSEATAPMSGIFIKWSDRSQSPILDMSYAGVVVPASGLVSKFKVGAGVEGASLRIENQNDPIELKLRVLRLTAQTILFGMDSINTDGRIKIEQHLKDDLVVKNLKLMNPKTILAAMQPDIWWHGPFDTNLLLWKKPNSDGVLKALIEYDSLVMIYDDGKITLMKSRSTTEESQGYSGDWMIPPVNKVSMGASWSDRVLKMLKEFSVDEPKAKTLESLMQGLRES